MERPEALVVKNINFLTVEEITRLKDQASKYGKHYAETGLPTISNNLEKLIDLARNEKTPTFIPADFLENAATYLWETETDITSIFDLYKKWLQFYIHDAKTRMESDIINDLQSSFANLAGKFTTEEKDPIKQKHTLTKSIDFIDTHSCDPQSKVEHLMYYGKYLFEHGMEQEGRKIITTTAKLVPTIVARLLDLKAIVEQVRED